MPRNEQRTVGDGGEDRRVGSCKHVSTWEWTIRLHGAPYTPAELEKQWLKRCSRTPSM